MGTVLTEHERAGPIQPQRETRIHAELNVRVAAAQQPTVLT